MHFCVNRETPLRQVGYIVQALDDVTLPEGAGQVQRASVEPGDLDAELAPVAGLGQCDVAQVELHVEIGVFYPVGPIHAAGHFYQPRAKQRQAIQTLLEIGDHLLEANEATRGSRGIVDAQPADMLGRIGLFEVDECAVEYA